MKRQPKKHQILYALCGILGALLVLITVELVYSSYALTVSRYVVRSEKVNDSIRIVFLSDLHGREFGTDNERLLVAISNEQPDLIALVGDMINHNADANEIDRVCGFIRRASDIAPVFFSNGNHEQSYLRTHDTELLERVRESGAVVLAGEYVDLEFCGTPLRIAGNRGYYRQPIMTTLDPEQIKREIAFADAFEETDSFKLLLDHVPTTWLDWDYINTFPVDLILSGHYHGGVVRIPILEQGLYAPYVGWFPAYTKGLFEGSKATCVLTTGLAGSKFPRFFNPPEIAVVDLMPEEPSDTCMY